MNQKEHENYLLLDHRACGGTLVEAATYRCPHCTGIIVKRPERIRERHKCWNCAGKLICDSCFAISREPDYIHRSWEEVVDLVRAGKAELLPGSTHGRPLLLFK